MSGINPWILKEGSACPGIINQGTGEEKILIKWLMGSYFFKEFAIKSFLQGTILDIGLRKVSKNAGLNVAKIIDMAII